MSGILVPKTQLASALDLFTPETQKKAAVELNMMLSEAMQPYIGKDCDEKNLHYMRLAIKETVKKWFAKHPVMTLRKLNIDFQLEVDKQQGKITIKPSFDFQRLIAGMIPY